jgi:DNA-binding NtrC family response regulator
VRAAFAAFAAVTVLPGCSGGDGGDGRLSKEEYVERADAICTEYERRLDELPEPANIRELGDVAARALPLARRGVRELKALRSPEEVRADVHTWLERNDRNLVLLAALRDAARAGKTTRVQEIASEAADNEAAADRLAKRIGLRACAESGS